MVEDECDEHLMSWGKKETDERMRSGDDNWKFWEMILFKAVGIKCLMKTLYHFGVHVLIP